MRLSARAYYNEFDKKAAAMLRQLIKDGIIADGDVDERSILDVRSSDLKGYTQCHFFAGIGGWSVSLRLAGWPDDRPVWTGSTPCQPFSTAGKQKGAKDERDLWPVWAALIRECRPAACFGEQVSTAIRHGWLDRMRSDMEAEGYAIGAAVLPACSVNAPHKRDRAWFVAYNASTRLERATRESLQGRSERSSSGGSLGYSSGSASERGTRGFSEAQGGERGTGSQDGHQPVGSADASEILPLGNPTGERCGETGECIRRSTQWLSGSGTLGDTESEQNKWEGQARFQPESTQHGDCLLGSPSSERSQGHGEPREQHDKGGWQESHGHSAAPGFWDNHEWILCGDGKARRIPKAFPKIRELVDGLQHISSYEYAICSEQSSEKTKEKEVNAAPSQERTYQILQALWNEIRAEEVFQQSSRGLWCLYATRTLLSILWKQQRDSGEKHLRSKSEEIFREIMQSLRDTEEITCTPYGSRLVEQQSYEFDDVVRILSSRISLVCGNWISLTEVGIKNSAPLLHAFGNAIVPAVAAKFILASM